MRLNRPLALAVGDWTGWPSAMHQAVWTEAALTLQVTGLPWQLSRLNLPTSDAFQIRPNCARAAGPGCSQFRTRQAGASGSESRFQLDTDFAGRFPYLAEA